MNLLGNSSAGWASVGVNVDVEAIDVLNSGASGLFGRYSYGRYGLREGMARLIGALQENAVKATFYTPLADLQRHPELLKSVLDAGHEIATRGRVATNATANAQHDALADEHEAMRRLVGDAPRGWRSIDGLLNRHTLAALARTGYRYDSSFSDDDLPRTVKDATGLSIVELPVFDYLTDAPFYALRHTHARVRKVWLEEAEAQYCAGAFVHLTLSTRGDSGSTRLPRVAIVSQWLRAMCARPGLAFQCAGDLAERWRAESQESEPFPDHPAAQV